ncbi:MAG: His/Gly/Thr/Pro-type tRNA ligase C-terminal domain-containing protein, partial [Acidobacteria bacterium]|nr:His/Gly/Thr/Pro-type tRNA ligase C-terminal domain-containing protein [Acidobacteriota bacterium]
RTTEFLWQEGHTAHATHEEAEEEVLRILEIYRRFAEDYLALPVLTGVKTEKEKFAGALRTYAIEALMQDGRALQAGTSHDLGQNFARAFDVRFQAASGGWEHVWNTSWGVSTRLIGAVVMAHGDDDGLVLPPRVAPVQAVIVPIWRNDEQQRETVAAAREIESRLRQAGVAVRVDDRDTVNPGFKYAEWELRGVPLRLELGPRDVAGRSVMAVSRVDRSKTSLPWDGLDRSVPAQLEAIQQALFERARQRRDETTKVIDSWDEFVAGAESGGFLHARHCGALECELTIQDETKATVRVIPSNRPIDAGPCVRCGGPAEGRMVFARAY